MIFRKSFEKTLYKSKKRYYNIIIKWNESSRKVRKGNESNEEVQDSSWFDSRCSVRHIEWFGSWCHTCEHSIFC